MNGARKARGDVLVFLDAHMEVGVAWLEPLLERIVSQPQGVVQPDILDIEYRHPKTSNHSVVNGESYKKEQDNTRPGMSWEMSQNWFPFPPYLHQAGYRQTDAFPSPALQGSAIVVRRSYFMSIRGFDEGLNIWGGEQLELALKVWMTGGRVETVPCSIVGHVFKDNPNVKTDKEDIAVTKNVLRIAEIWMDEYADFVIANSRANSHNGHLPTLTSQEVESIHEGRHFRERMGSKTFKWYLEHVFPELKVPSRDDLLWGEVMKDDKCLLVVDDTFVAFDDVCESYGITFKTIFSLDKRGSLRNNGQCFGLDAQTMNLVMIPCCKEDMAESVGEWEYTEHDQLMYRSPSGTYCLSLVTSKDAIHMESCESTNEQQSWSFQIRFEWES
ncbi:polypeptide N-acetylgalactosaminyltransferase 5-like [Haliotis rubra]|uniref:polypeptide N-acetylgalactosaminyltransferase 5-like n=1 Tax=Haliotis rubra TaxID=36100 RepID=UPI001EE5B400|nr:polypeptide N-acetylgalactosaminyltransferase 5-like [Haliotis rubra]